VPAGADCRYPRADYTRIGTKDPGYAKLRGYEFGYLATKVNRPGLRTKNQTAEFTDNDESEAYRNEPGRDCSVTPKKNDSVGCEN
jgi:hypothetical protein